ncbi:phage tail sheath C-terminal domain-containing protein [Culicoidibacter larvae]|uniref:Uncharacterized protein n=1 Tax=Culicoidibacter larvae TaxID=2579976 RepID=A0A5R8Q7F8_9FIRM|nr:phage tail sheath C-terminal domain-containing protein [Culicoidibacter larvae]TLG71374.1 hypothetical protein FEZ08_10795 [Culicoidibacter larvae]
MAGGNFNSHNKQLPGAYINVRGVDTRTQKSPGIGTVAMPIQVDYGPEMEVIKVTVDTDFLALFGAPLEEIKPLYYALMNTSEVLACRVGRFGKKAKNTIGDIEFTAKYAGVGGNQISVGMETTASGVKVSTYFNGKTVDIQVVNAASEVKANKYVDVKLGSNEDLVDTAPALLAGGQNGQVQVADYVLFTSLLAELDYYVLVNTFQDQVLSNTFKEYILEERSRGNYVVLVLPSIGSYTEVNDPAITVVENGFGGLSQDVGAAFVAGAMAGAPLGKTLTYKVVPGVTEASGYTDDEKIDFLNKGRLIFIRSYDRVVILNDINSLTTYTEDLPEYFSKNSVIRTLDFLQRSIKYNFETNFIGKIQNDADGRGLLKQDILLVMQELLTAQAIENFREDDVQVLPGETKDSVICNIAIQVTDAVEKLYLTVNVG